MLDIALFRNPRFTAASGSVAIAFFALNGFIFLTTQYFQIVKGFGPLGTGVRLLPVAGSVAVASVAGTRLAVRIGNKIIVGGGLTLFSAALLWISTVSQATSYGRNRRADGRVRHRDGADQAPATEAIMGAVPNSRPGSARPSMTRPGCSVAPSASPSSAASPPRRTSRPPAPAGCRRAAQQASHAGFTQFGSRLKDAAILAFLHSFAGGCLVAGAVAAASALVAIFLLPARPADPKTQARQLAATDPQHPSTPERQNVQAL